MAADARASRVQSCRYHPHASDHAGAAALDIVAAALHVITGNMELTGGAHLHHFH